MNCPYLDPSCYAQNQYHDDNSQLKSRMERMPLQASTQIEPYAEEFEERRSAPQRGGWGSEPPDPGSALTRKTRSLQVYTAYRVADYQGSVPPDPASAPTRKIAAYKHIPPTESLIIRGQYLQIQVLPLLAKIAAYKYIPPTESLITNGSA